MNGPLLFTIGLPVALKDLKQAIGAIRSAIEKHFDTTLPPFYARGESGGRIWILDDYAVNVPVVPATERNAALDARKKLSAKIRGQYKTTKVPWLDTSGIRLLTNDLLNYPYGHDTQFVFKEFDLRTNKLDDAQKENTDPEITYKTSLDKAFPLWRREKAQEISKDDMAVRVIVKYDTNKEKSRFSFGISRDFDKLDVIWLVKRLRSMHKLGFESLLQNTKNKRSLVINVAAKNGTRNVEQVHNAFSDWKWDTTKDLLFETIEGLWRA